MMTKKEIIKAAKIKLHNDFESLFHRGGTTIMKNQGDFILVNDEIITLEQLYQFKHYNIYNDVIDDDVLFCIQDNLFIIISPDHGLVTRKIKENFMYEIVYEFMKTIVKCRKKEELIQHFKDANDPKSPFNSIIYGLLKRIA